MEHKRSRLLQLIALVCLLVVVDQVTKSIVRKAFTPGGSIPLIGDVLRITFVQNFEGFSWWVPTLPLWVKSAFRVVLICIALLAFPVYSFYTQTRRQSTWADIAVAGITASALGHLMDDLFVPYTTDFFQVFHSPSANLADVYSYVGIGALAVEMIYVFRVRKRKGKAFRHLLVDAVRTRKEFLEFILRGPAECMNRNRGIEPMPFWQSLVLFGIPGIIVYLNIYVGVPYLVGVGVPLIICFPPLLLLPVLLPASLVIYRHEGNEMSWARLKERFRLDPIQGRQWLWVAGVFICAQLSDVVFGFIGLDSIGRWLASIPLFAPPPYLPAFMDPRVELEIPFTEFLGAHLEGNWWILLWWLCLMFLSNLGEELMWRGYILPRQELSLGKRAWLVNGLLWNFVVHGVLKWQYIGMIPSMLLAPWLAQKLKNTWASFLVHFGGNLLIVVLLLPGILGAGS